MMPASVNARVTRATCSTVTPFFMSSSNRSEATSRPPLTATQPESASRLAELRREGLLETDVAPPGDADLLGDQAFRERAHGGGRRGFVDEVKARLARLRDQRLDAPHDEVGARLVVTADVVERHIAERALLPVAAVRQRDLVPAAVRPEAMHRVQHFHDRHVFVERQAVVGRDARVFLRDVVLHRVGFEHDVVALAYIGAHAASCRGRSAAAAD